MVHATSGFNMGGEWRWVGWRARDPDTGKQYRDSKGRFTRMQLFDDTFHNIVTNEGRNHILDVVLHATAAVTTWYCEIGETNTAASTALTYAVPSFTACTSYDEATRPAYAEAAANTGGVTTNAGTVAVFTISATKTVYGAALVGGGTAGSTKADSAGAGVMLCYALAGTARACLDNDVLNLTYTVSCADDGV